MVEQRLADAGATRLDVQRMQEVSRPVKTGDPQQAIAAPGQIDFLLDGVAKEVGGLVPLRRDPGEGLAQDTLVKRRAGRDLVRLRAPYFELQACMVQPSTPMAA